MYDPDFEDGEPIEGCLWGFAFVIIFWIWVIWQIAAKKL